MGIKVVKNGHKIDYSPFIGIEYNGLYEDGMTFNCWSLMYALFVTQKEADVKLFDSLPVYEQVVAEDEMALAMAVLSKNEDWIQVKEDEAQVGDVIMFKIGSLLHCGMIVDHKRFIHCLKGRETCTERLNSLQWASRVEGIYRWAN